jgi:signal transduction histidine kinase
MHPNLFSKNTPPRPLSEAFIASLAHDIKNTLCIAQGAITLAQLQPHTSTNLETANQAITKANELIEALLTYATTGTPPKKTQTQLGELLNHTLALIFNNTPEITHTLSLPNPLPTIELNRLDLFRILQNIFVNAQQAMGSKGHIFIHGKYLAQNGQPPTHLELKIQDKREEYFSILPNIKMSEIRESVSNLLFDASEIYPTINTATKCGVFCNR